VRKYLKLNFCINNIMSGSRSLAAARNRRAGDVNTKITPGRSMNTIGQQSMHKQNAYQQPVQQSEPTRSNGLPFSKLTISDAIGLITLRLGKVEQHLIDQQNNTTNTNASTNSNSIDTTLLTSLTRRLDELEKIEKSVNFDNLKGELTETAKQLAIIKKQFSEYKTEINDRFQDYEEAIVELETKILPENMELSDSTAHALGTSVIIDNTILSSSVSDDAELNKPDNTNEETSELNKTSELNETTELNETLNASENQDSTDIDVADVDVNLETENDKNEEDDQGKDKKKNSRRKKVNV
jgi:hypothetical protein